MQMDSSVNNNNLYSLMCICCSSINLSSHIEIDTMNSNNVKIEIEMNAWELKNNLSTQKKIE